MNQPQNPVPPRGTRPQLFNAPAATSATSANAKRHADFGPSILSTIDGGQARFASQRDYLSLKRVLLMGVLALMALAIYLGVMFSESRTATAPEAVAVHAVAAAPVAVKAAEVAPSAPRTTELAQGAAAIETVAPPEVPASSPASNQPAGVATSMNNIQLALDRSEPAPIKQEKAVAKGVQPARKSPVAHVSKPADKRVARGADSDAELLAAMLPHLKRLPPAPSSPAYEKRCGQLTGDAAVDCRAKFCKGREGADAACPAALDADAGATSRTPR